MSILYRLLTFLLTPLWLLYLLVRQRGQARLRERLGFLPVRQDSPIWIQGVSVGEIRIALKLASVLRERSLPVVLSSTTAAGLALAAREWPFGEPAAFPLDLASSTERALERLKPRALVVVETELWPVLFRKAVKEGIPVFVVNGRISDRSLKRVQRLKTLYAFALEGTRIAAQNEEHALRFITLGAKKHRTVVLGNLKYDLSPPSDFADTTAELSRFCSATPLWTAGSVREGEETAVIKAHERVREKIPAARLILAPRHLSRSSLCLEACRKAGFHAVARSGEPETDWDVLILDTVGELWSAYSLCSAAFVGGSLVNMGGQNVLEPAFLEKPVLFGPSTENFREDAERLLAAGGAVRVNNIAELGDEVSKFLADSERARLHGQRAAEAVSRYRGAVERTVSWIEKNLPG